MEGRFFNMLRGVGSQWRQTVVTGMINKHLTWNKTVSFLGRQQGQTSFYQNLRTFHQTATKHSSIKQESGDEVPTDSPSSPKSMSDLLDDALTESPAAPIEFPSDKRELAKERNDMRRMQERHAYRPEIDPDETSIFLFPGQGSQFVGMGKQLLDYPGVRDMYDVASSILGYDLLDICLNGPKSKLDRTVYCQPAIMVTSLAAVEKLRGDNPWAIERCISAAGFSVGEYSALVFAGSLGFEDAVEVVKVRAEAMQRASEEVDSGMMTVFLGPDNKLKMACHTAKRFCVKKLGMEDAVCEVANYLYPECKVVAGNKEALQFIEKNKNEFGIRRVSHLPVSGAFHTPLMKPAERDLKDILQSVNIAKPIIPVHSNVDSHRYNKPEQIGPMLVQQLCRPVKWEQIQHVLFARKHGMGFPDVYEVGPNRQLGQLLNKTNSKAFEKYNRVRV